MRLLLFISLIFGANLSLFSQMKNIPLYPAGITVEWSALPPVEATEPPSHPITTSAPTPAPQMDDDDEKNKKVSKWRKPKAPPTKKAPEPIENLEPLAPVVAPKPAVAKPVSAEPIAVNRLIRVVNALNLDTNQRLALIFYNEKGAIIPKQLRVVTNTERPSASRIFFMDKVSYSAFKGVLDVYFVPKEAEFMNVAIIDKNDKIVRVPTHPTYDAKNMLAINDFLNTEPANRIMLQFEIAGSPEKGVLRLGGFRFGKAR